MQYFRPLTLLLLLMTGFQARSQDQPASPPAQTAIQKEIAQVVQQFTATVNKGDAAALSAFFAADARLVTVDGEVITGRESILEFFQAGIDGNPGLKIENDVRSIRTVNDTAAVETGFTSSTTDSDKKPRVVAYHILHVKRDGKWQMFDIFETAPADQSDVAAHLEKLADLDAMIGEWSEDSESATITHHIRWSPNHRFLLIDYIADTGAGKPELVSQQRIGWDARNKSIRSWVFEEDGGHGTALWTKDPANNAWLVKAEATLSTGQLATSTLRLEKQSEDKVVIRTYDRTIDGEPVGDAPLRTLVRKPSSKKPSK